MRPDPFPPFTPFVTFVVVVDINYMPKTWYMQCTIKQLLWLSSIDLYFMHRYMIRAFVYYLLTSIRHTRKKKTKISRLHGNKITWTYFQFPYNTIKWLNCLSMHSFPCERKLSAIHISFIQLSPSDSFSPRSPPFARPPIKCIALNGLLTQLGISSQFFFIIWPQEIKTGASISLLFLYYAIPMLCFQLYIHLHFIVDYCSKNNGHINQIAFLFRRIWYVSRQMHRSIIFCFVRICTVFGQQQKTWFVWLWLIHLNEMLDSGECKSLRCERMYENQPRAMEIGYQIK